MSGYKNSDDSPMYFYGHCAYPSCRSKKIAKDEPFVEWHGVSFSPEQIEDSLSPMAKLAVIANPSKHVEKFGEYGFNMFLHPKCAAEWGMHLIKDALGMDYNLGSVLRESKHAIRK